MKNKGFTLLETVIALALWLILSAGIFFVWSYSTHRSAAMIERQSAFENARISFDAIKMNFQMSRIIDLQTNNDVLQSVRMCQPSTASNRNCQHGGGLWHDYRFTFDASRQRLTFPDAGNEFSSNIAEIKIFPNDTQMHIKITTACSDTEPIVIEGSFCVRHKTVIVNGVG
jgi:prepilin-type N-terminal cleavage/methylation domain-containing protein